MSFLNKEKANKSRITRQIRNTNILLVILILMIVIIFVSIMLSQISNSVSENYVKLYSQDTKSKFELYIANDIALVESVSKSNEIVEWFNNENNLQCKMDAFEKLNGYVKLLPNTILYVGINNSLGEYFITNQTTFDDFNPFDILDPNIAYNDWYYHCIQSKDDYTLNVDVDKATNTTMLWINHKVIKNGIVIGAFCVGLPFDDFVYELFKHFDKDKITNYVIDKNGYIRIMSSNIENSNVDVSELTSILNESEDKVFISSMQSYINSIDEYFKSDSETQLYKLKNGDYKYMSISPISGTDWSVVTLFNSDTLFSYKSILPLIFIMLATFIVYTIISSLMIKSLLITPLNNLIDSVSAVSTTGENNIFGSKRSDEIGDLSKTIQEMNSRLGNYNKEIFMKESERERQSKLLHAVNSTASILLSADEENFEKSLHDGMDLMAKCMDVDRIYIWKNEIINNVLNYIQKFAWIKDDNSYLNSIKRKTGFSYIESIPSWEEKFTNAICINSPIENLSLNERERLENFGIKSLLVIPIYLQDTFWGFVSFDDCHSTRYFTEDEVSILRSGSLMLASAINKKDIQEKMKEADEITKLMLDATPLCCNLWNKNFQNIECNEEAVKLFELKDKKEYLERFFELSPEYQPDGELSSTKALRQITKAFEQGIVVFEWLHNKLDGTLIPSEITLVRVKYGNEYIVSGYTRDLREYKKMMKEIEYKDKLLHMVNNVSAILLQTETNKFEMDLWQCMGMMASAVGVDRVYIWKNSQKDGKLYCSQLYEWSEGVEPQQGKDLVIDVPYSENVPTWESTLSSGICINGIVSKMAKEERNQLEPQNIKSILVIPTFLQDKFWGFVGFDDCVNERIFTNNETSILRSGSLIIANALLRNEMEAEQRASAAKMEAVITNYTGVIFSVDKKNIITLFNGLYLKEIGVTPSFLEGKSMDLAIKRNRHLDIVENVKKTFEEGAQEWISDVDSKKYRAHTTPMYDKNGSVTGVVGTLDDITDTIRLQNELEKAAIEARSASKAKSDFLSNMSHEMRTPMNAIIGMTAIAKSSKDIDKKDYCLNKIDDASTHLLGVINDILDMSKIEANKFNLSYSEFSFEKMLQKVVNVINFRLDEKHQVFTVKIDNNIPDLLFGDDLRLSQVITNLLSNAVKFTPENGSINLRANLIEIQDNIANIQIEVEDSGIGISKEQQSRLFTSFQQAENSTSRRYGGTGLGLAISKRIIEMMKGKIWIESELGEGSRFIFTVNIECSKNKLPSSDKTIDWGKIRILVVDDAEEILDYMNDILKNIGVKYSLARSGNIALEMIKENGLYDICFVDWKMPEMNGIELTRLIKENNAGKSIVIMISSTEWSVIESEAKLAGVDKYLAKPLFPSAIKECISDYVGIFKVLEVVDKRVEDNSDNFEGYNMLLAEDIDINREIVIAMLEYTNIKIDCAENGAQAVELFKKNYKKYDVIFMDVQMPEMDGNEATKKIRDLNIKKAKEIPIIAMTANVFKEDVEKCLAAGMNNHIGKPLDFDELLKVIKKYLRKK